jgi:undecaprenyl-diphosphatase
MVDWDVAIQQFLNREIAHPVLDGPMVLVSLLGNLLPFSLLAFAVARYGRKVDVFRFLFAVAATAAFVAMLKDIIGRMRPEDARILLDATSTYGMPSGHAARTVAAAVALWALGPRWRVATFGFAALTMVSRVYVGVHWPSDVLLGALIGTVSGLVAIALVDNIAYELSLIQTERAPGLLRVWKRFADFFRWLAHADYLYSLRLVGRVSAEQAARLSRLSTYWGLIRFFGPIIMIVAGWLVFLGNAPALATRSVGCLLGYFAPFGIEFGVPLCIGLGVPWWLVVAMITYIDAFLIMFLIINFDLLHSIPRVGRWLHGLHERGSAFVAKRPWITRIQFVGIALFVFVPLPMTGAAAGVVLGRFIGMRRLIIWSSVMLGTVVRITLYSLAAAGLWKLF